MVRLLRTARRVLRDVEPYLQHVAYLQRIENEHSAKDRLRRGGNTENYIGLLTRLRRCQSHLAKAMCVNMVKEHMNGSALNKAVAKRVGSSE
jgi:hypothetical protein